MTIPVNILPSPVHRPWSWLWATLLLVSPSPSRAETFNIADGDVSGLVEAINKANENRAHDIINLAPGGTYVFTTSVVGENGLPPVGNDGEFSGFHRLTLNGNGSTLTRSTTLRRPQSQFGQLE